METQEDRRSWFWNTCDWLAEATWEEALVVTLGFIGSGCMAVMIHAL